MCGNGTAQRAAVIVQWSLFCAMAAATSLQIQVKEKSKMAVGLDNSHRPLPAVLFQSENEAKVTNK